MSELAAILGTVAALLTALATYRLFSFVAAGSPAFGVLMAVASTSTFMYFFDFVILLFGLAALVSPAGVAYYFRDRIPFLDRATSQVGQRFRRYLGLGDECTHCNTMNESGSRRCKNCGRTL